MFAFELGREFRLSIAEIFKVFSHEGNTLFCDKKILILDGISKQDILQKAKRLGGTIKIMEVVPVQNEIENVLEKHLGLDTHE